MANEIALYQEEDTIVIQIECTERAEKPTATIISHTGETVKRFDLKGGKNTINITRYSSKNYSVRIQHGRNILVQKIGI